MLACSPRALAALVVGLIAFAPVAASAQAELTGTYIRYLGVGANGRLMNSSNHSMQYTESGSTPYSCDAFFPGSDLEGFTVETSGVSGTNSDTSTDITTLSGPTVSGRRIVWTGRLASGSVDLLVEQEASLGSSDRFVTMSVTLTNDGSSTLSNVYYLRNADPDHGSCGIGTGYETANAVLRQPPEDGSALITATAGSPSVVLGIGSLDARARVSSHTFTNSDASGTWTSPTDPLGASEDLAIDIVFRESSLTPGESTTFVYYYVWGTSTSSVGGRLDSLVTCFGEGSRCTVGERTGTCRDGGCCTGCWDGRTCQSGRMTETCGASGTACVRCGDENDCTIDLCEAGSCTVEAAPSGTRCDDGFYCTELDTCSGTTCRGTTRSCDDEDECTTDRCDETSNRCTNTRGDGCTIEGSCVAAGTGRPGVPCEACIPSVSTSFWSPRETGTACGAAECADGSLYAAPTCDEAGDCIASTPSPCPSGACASASACEVPAGTDGGVGSDGGMAADGSVVMTDGAIIPRPDGGGMGTSRRGGRRSGCTVGPGPGGHGGAWWLLASVAALWMRRRAR